MGRSEPFNYCGSVWKKETGCLLSVDVLEFEDNENVLVLVLDDKLLATTLPSAE